MEQETITKTWQGLPSELVSHICEFLYHSHPSSLVSLAMSNKACYAAATTFLFRTIKFFVSTRGQLASRVKGRLRRLSRDGAFGRVHRLIVFGPGPDTSEDSQVYRRKIGLYHTSASEHATGLETRFDEINCDAFQTDGSPVERVYQINEYWRPLAELIQQLPALQDLVYECSGQFPPCLLQILHEHLPKCRLHLDTFHLRSLSSKWPIADGHELMIATSPCLYSINMKVRTGVGSTPVHHIGEVLRLVAGLAPNLKEVHLDCGYQGLWRPEEEYSSFHPPWDGLPIAKVASRRLGSLSCLHLYGNGCERRVTGDLLDEWSRHTNFAILRSLRINTQVTEDALATLANSHSFPSLETLVLALLKPSDVNESRPNGYYEMATQFLGSVPGLRALEITNWAHHASLDTILGSELQTLRLRACEGEHLIGSDIAQIRKRCPLLQDLTMTICRSNGDANEVSVYRELGSLPRLQHLSLEMDPLVPLDTRAVGRLSGDWRSPLSPNFPGTNPEVHASIDDLGYYLVVNSAIDNTLALTIFETISGTSGRQDLASLQKLEISYIQRQRAGKYSRVTQWKTNPYSRTLHRRWQVDCIAKDDSRRLLSARELGKEGTEAVWVPLRAASA
ncbi:hypothetical protein F4677DRAFT_401626 [Hypoxylon crocopeplum]|nr:hypothetical protein F4677DRAFT_401626 [Hypoxylon crocopeplum]